MGVETLAVLEQISSDHEGAFQEAPLGGQASSEWAPMAKGRVWPHPWDLTKATLPHPPTPPLPPPPSPNRPPPMLWTHLPRCQGAREKN